MDPLIGAALIGGGTSLLGGLLGGKSSGSQTVSKEPGSFVNTDASQLSSAIWKILNDPDFAKKFQDDADWRKEADFGMVDRTDQSLGGYIDVLKKMQDYESGAQQFGTIGGNKLDFLPRGAENISNRMGAKGQDIFGKTLAQETMRNTAMNQNTPNKGFMDWLAMIVPQVNAENARRSGLPTTTENAEYSPSGMGMLGDLVKNLTPLYESYVNQKKPYQMPEDIASFNPNDYSIGR